jgi:hypothetical protein
MSFSELLASNEYMFHELKQKFYSFMYVTSSADTFTLLIFVSICHIHSVVSCFVLCFTSFANIEF